MSEVFPSHILAWMHSSEVIQMEEIPAGDPRRMVQGFAADPLCPHPTPRFDYEDPYEQDEDHLKKVTRYWATQVEAAVQRHAAEQVAKDDIAGPSRSVKDKGREVPKTPRRTPRKAMRLLHHVWSRKVRCEFLDKTVWAVLEGSKKMAEAIRELAGMEKRREYSQLELKWYELQHFTFDLQRSGELDVAAADYRLLQMLNLKAQGLDIPADLEEQFHTEHVDIEMKVREHVEAVMQCMEEIRGNTGLDLLGGGPPDSLTPFGKRKAVDEEDDEEQEEKEEHAGRRKKRKVISDDE
ncbi:hypothetical protein M422DRAFT_264295 [Sphaerobolus stellatus SS14]|uniref:Uncharacterized protein n=1 Tax=Sphaerobolus stellatus (strain SS14) TaxID=990650 RepID=A0A0C9UWM4_SPHS4|nr:hypothetical protein M422DRAFT_264295 [Sphaerobolus stellatus SS14]